MSYLFSPITLRSLTLDNRIVYSPMGQYMSDDDGAASDWHLIHLGMMSLSGAGLVFTEATAVEPRGMHSPHGLALWTDRHEAALKRVIDSCRRYAPAKHAIQLWHVGRKGSVGDPWDGSRYIPREKGGWPVVAASPLPFAGRDDIPVAPDEDGLNAIEASFVQAAQRAARIGYDLLELHCAHGYLLYSFLSPISNKRTDRWGGDLEGRMRFPLRVFKAVRAAWPEDRPMGVRVSATDWFPGGWTVEDATAFARELKALGCDYVTPSSGGSTPEQKIKMGPGYQADFATAIRTGSGIATMAVGLINDPRFAEYLVSTEKCDMVALGRGLVENPRWPWDAAKVLEASVPHPKQYMRGEKPVWLYSSATKR